jgi:hypothetical protein
MKAFKKQMLPAVLAGIASVSGIAGFAKASTVTLSVTASGGTWDLYASDSTGDNAGIAVFGIDVDGLGGVTITGDENDAPTDGIATGFSNLEQDNNGTPGQEIAASQNVVYAASFNATKNARVLVGIGQTAGSAEAGAITWAAPVLLADGTYTGSGSITALAHPGDTIQTLNGTTSWTGPGNTTVATVIAGTTLVGGPPPKNPLVSLTAEGSQETTPGYGHNTIPTLVLTGSHGSYVGAADTGLSGTLADVEVMTFNPATDNEVYALKLAGITGGTTEINAIVAEINANSVGVVASDPPSSDISATFPGYQIELVAKSGSQSAVQDLGIDLSNLAENATPGTVTLSAVAAIPEPASIGLLMGASGLLLGRRKRKA